MRSAGHRRAVLSAITVALLGACGGGEARRADFAIQETSVVLDTSVPFARSDDIAGRVESTVAAALRYWGGDWRDLAGVTITLADTPWVVCGGARSLGCWDGDIRVTTSDPGAGPFACVEQTVLVHEVGHAVIGDPGHEDPRWMDLEPVQRELGGRRGYRDDGPVDCDIALSVWRHPPRG